MPTPISRRRGRVLRRGFGRRFAVRRIVCLNRMLNGRCLGNVLFRNRFRTWQPDALDNVLATRTVADKPDQPDESDNEADQRRVVVEPESTDLIDGVDSERLDPEPTGGVPQDVEGEHLAMPEPEPAVYSKT